MVDRRRIAVVGPHLGHRPVAEAVAHADRLVNTRRRSADEAGEAPQRLDALRTWHNDATLALHDLAAAGSAPRSGKRLIAALSKNAMAMATLESARQRWHVSAAWAREAIHLRREVATSVVGAALPSPVDAHLELAHSTFMLEGNSPRLRSTLRQATTDNPSSAALAYWSARYDLIAGNHAEALRTIKAIDSTRVRELLPLVSPVARTAPWVPYPCNFYTYRHAIAGDDTLRAMQEALAAQVATAGVHAEAGIVAMGALLSWSQANRDMEHEKYASATRNYVACQRAVLTYFATRFAGRFHVPEDDEAVYAELVRVAHEFIRYSPATRPIWTYFRQRYAAISLEELYELDWIRPGVAPDEYRVYRSAENMLRAMLQNAPKVEEKISAPLLALGLIFAPLGAAEANRQRRNFDEALRLCREILRRHTDFKLLCELIEKPFVKILYAQTLLEKGDAEYKSRLLANSPARNPDGSLRYQGLAAAETYAGVPMAFEDQGQYVARVESGLAALQTESRALLLKSIHPLVQLEPGLGLVPMNRDERTALAVLGKPVPIPTVMSRQPGFPGHERQIGPHESIIRFEPPPGEDALRETNPLVYAILAQARSRLLQLEAGLNFLGYSDAYVPPWRFQFLLTRARYFAEHAKNAEREYLNFLQNAEREEQQELSVAQNVVLEKSNIRIENARMEQARLQLEAAKQSGELARLTASNAQRRADRYAQFDERADSLSEDVIGSSGLSMAGAAGTGALGGAVAGAVVGSVVPGIGTVVGAIGGAIIGGLSGLFSSAGADKSQGAALAVADEQRAYEQESLALAATESVAAIRVADAHTAVSASVVEVAALQRASALLRHEFAVQSLQFLRNRTLGAELWYRLAHLIRGVSDTYLRYAVELSFLAEQAYEFEVDKRVNVIRFDYDVSEIGSLLAADFLLADLDTLEQDLIVSERTRQQPVRYIVSLAREFPDALAELQQQGSTIITIPLESVERRLPGFYNLRVGSMEVVPLALLDRTRFGIEVTHLGTSQVRRRASPDGPPGAPPLDPHNAADLTSWIPEADPEWPVNVRVYGPETAFFSGITAAAAAADPAFAFAAEAQRGAFEHRGVAGSWRLDLSMPENQILPGSLTDFLVAFNLRGYHDPQLRDLVDHAQRRRRIGTRWLSARASFPDAYYRFQQTGRMEWDLRDRSHGLAGGTLRNAGVMLLPAARRPSIGRVVTSHALELTIAADGTLTTAHDVPEIGVAQSGLHVEVTVTAGSGATVRCSFDGGATWKTGSATAHDYRRPGAYEVIVRVERARRLFEHTMALAVSDTVAPPPPLLARPTVTTGAGDGNPVPAGLVRVVAAVELPTGLAADTVWKVPGQPARAGASVQLDLPPGPHLLAMTTVRRLTARIYGRQVFAPDDPIEIAGLRILSNRTFDADGNDVTAAPNTLAQHLFAAPLAPADTWTLDVPPADNPALHGVDSPGMEGALLREIQDLILILEHEQR